MIRTPFSIITLSTFLLSSSLPSCFVMASSSSSSSSHRPKQLNVLGAALELCSKDPLTGYARDGYCSTRGDDYGKHLIAAVVSDEFLSFSKGRGNDLITPHPPSFPGLRDGDRWCLCVDRWKEAYDYAKEHEGQDRIVPRVVLSATHSDALKTIDLDVLKKYSTK
eukprot:TRINITY_DN10515_c0_g1_i1.p1 TRINITY_DN10515_c0_g1~~TRINITY_DN10515_c0_g1_i1.p1  ORF type:complete len:180 (-),score=33.75 TRINITY_DN10515_c0_g1_i1:33-527(-)